MATGSARQAAHSAEASAQQAAGSRTMSVLARAGLAARGVMYVLVGALAIQVAFGNSGKEADRSGALRVVASTPFGEAALWVLAVGFIGLALWRLSEAIWGAAGPEGRKASKRLASGGRAVLYGVIAFSVMKYALGLGAPQSSNKQSQDLTAKLMHYPGGQFLVGAIGLALIVGGAALAYRAWHKRFLKHMRMATASPATRRAVTRLGQVGGIVRGTVFAAGGIFLMVAAVTANPSQAKGVDSTLRTFASTPAGPWLLVLIAAGLITFGVYSGCEARWRDVEPSGVTGGGTSRATGGSIYHTTGTAGSGRAEHAGVRRPGILRRRI